MFSPQDGIRLVKRVVGIPGDEVEIKDNVLIINGQPMNYTEQSAAIGKDLPPNFRMSAEFAEEDLNGTKHWVMYLPEFNVPHRNFPKQTIPEGKLFVIGDSRDNSHDSRYFGVVDRNMVVGRATSVIVSFDKSRKWKPRWHRFFTSLYK